MGFQRRHDWRRLARNRRTVGDLGSPAETGAKGQLPHELVGAGGATLTATVDDTLALSDAVALQFEKVIADALGLSDNAGTETGKEALVNDAVALSDALALQVAIGLADSLALSDSVALAVQMVVGDAVTVDDAAQAVTGLIIELADALGISDALALEVRLVVADLAAVSDNVVTFVPGAATLILRMLMGVGR